MVQDNGWIKLHRKMLQNPIVTKTPEHFSVWIYLLLNTTHQPFTTVWNGKPITLQPGQLITSNRSIANYFKIDKMRAYRIIKDFEKGDKLTEESRLITIKAKKKGSLITVVKWDEYQAIFDGNISKNENNVRHKKELKNPYFISVSGHDSEKSDTQVRHKVIHNEEVKNPFIVSASGDISVNSETQSDTYNKKYIYKDFLEKTSLMWCKLCDDLRRSYQSETDFNYFVRLCFGRSENTTEEEMLKRAKWCLDIVSDYKDEHPAEEVTNAELKGIIEEWQQSQPNKG